MSEKVFDVARETTSQEIKSLMAKESTLNLISEAVKNGASKEDVNLLLDQFEGYTLDVNKTNKILTLSDHSLTNFTDSDHITWVIGSFVAEKSGLVFFDCNINHNNPHSVLAIALENSQSAIKRGAGSVVTGSVAFDNTNSKSFGDFYSGGKTNSILMEVKKNNYYSFYVKITAYSTEKSGTFLSPVTINMYALERKE